MADAIRAIVFAAACGALGACANDAALDNYTPSTSLVSEPAVGQVASAGVGETMLRSGQMQDLDAIEVMQEVRIGAVASYTVSPGYYVKRGEDERGEFFGIAFVAGAGRITAGALAQPASSLMLKKDGDGLCLVSVVGTTACRAHAQVKRVKLQGPGSVQQTLIYKGRMGARVRIGYRELNGEASRTDLSNDVDYDLKGSGVIGYKGARLEIIKATNQYVLYKVVRPFGGPGGDEMTASAETTARAADPADPISALVDKSLNQKLN